MARIFAIIDIETTGGRADRDKITEVAIALHDGEKVIDTYETLIDPERSIPANITRLTGISQETVAGAPKFFEVAKKIHQMTEGAVFVAHNVRFDYGFIREEFKRLGFSYVRKQLCTVRLSRKLMPGLRSYSLGKLSDHLGIVNDARHRAMGDVKATVELFNHLLKIEEQEEEIAAIINLGIKETVLPPGITLDILHGLPEECGVYYFHDEKGNVVYIGKSINIKKRVVDHFNNRNRKGSKIHEMVRSISYEITGSELAALLLEAAEIKKVRPSINKALRAVNLQHAIFKYKNQRGYVCLDVAKAKKGLEIVGRYKNGRAAKGHLGAITAEFNLCRKLNGLENMPGACFSHRLHECLGACVGIEPIEEYNQRVTEAFEAFEKQAVPDMVILEKGRTSDEKAVVLIEDNRYQGFGYVDAEVSNLQELKDAIKSYDHHPDLIGIIRTYLLGGKMVQRIPLG